MDVGGILAPEAINGIGLKQWHIGERLSVEIVQKTGDSKGIIRVNGQDMFALLETSTELGEKFWVKVGDIKDGNLLLIREPLMEKQGTIQLVSQQSQLLMERGIPNNEDIISFVKAFITENSGTTGTAETVGTTETTGTVRSTGTTGTAETEGTLETTGTVRSTGTTGNNGNVGTTNSLLGNIQGTIMDRVMVNMRKSIPEWNQLSEENGAEEIVECLRKLGLNYEQRLQKMIKLNSQNKEIEKNSLKDTFKYNLLKAIENQEGQDSMEPLTHLLQRLTGQQLWLKTGTLNNAYMLLQLPLLNQGQLVPIDIAIESSRKGSKMDEKHCRVAIRIKTEQLGEVGIDAYFNQDSLFFRILTRESQLLPQILEKILPQTRVAFAKLGFNIKNIETGDLDKNTEFSNFLKGSRRSGVDFRK